LEDWEPEETTTEFQASKHSGIHLIKLLPANGTFLNLPTFAELDWPKFALLHFQRVDIGKWKIISVKGYSRYILN